MNWDQSFSVSALCEDCDVSPQHIQYTWSLYLVNASSRPVIEGKILVNFHSFICQRHFIYYIFFCSILVPFCYTLDLGAPSTVIEGPATSPQTPGTSTLHPPAADASHYTRTVHAFATFPLTENASETAAERQNRNVTDRETSLKRNRNTLYIAGGLLNMTGGIKMATSELIPKCSPQ